MLIRFFRSGFFIQHFSIVVVALLLWFPVFVGQNKSIVFDGFHPFFDVFQPLFINQTKIGLVFLLLFFLVISFFFGRIVSEGGFQLRTGTHGMLLFVLMAGPFYLSTGFSPWLASLPFVLATMYHMLAFYNSKNLPFTVFYASFYSGLAVLFHLPNVLLFPVVFLSLIVARAHVFKLWIVPFGGFLAPFFFLSVYFFLTDTLLLQWEEFLMAAVGSSFSFQIVSVADVIQAAILIILTVVSFFWILGPSADNSIIMRKRTSILLFLFLALGPLHFLTQEARLGSGLMWIVPIIFVAGFFSHTKNIRWANIALLVLLLSAIGQQYIDYLWAY